MLEQKGMVLKSTQKQVSEGRKRAGRLNEKREGKKRKERVGEHNSRGKKKIVISVRKRKRGSGLSTQPIEWKDFGWSSPQLQRVHTREG